MTFLERYAQETTWQGKVLVMEIYHLAMSTKFPNWTLAKTAEYFGVSVGLVSENLRLANLIHADPNLTAQSRQDALTRMRSMR